MDVSPKRASTPVDDSELNNTAFSMDSLQIGDSTRSLLSPLYDKGRKSVKDSSFQEKSRSENDSCSSESSHSVSKVKLSDKSYSYSSDYEESETTVKKGKRKSVSASESSTTSSSSPLTTSKSKTKTKLCDNKYGSSVDSSETSTKTEPCLSPWEKWLLAKVVEDKKRANDIMRNKAVQKEIKSKEVNENFEKQRQAEANRKEWLRLKQSEKMKKETAERVKSENLQKKQEIEQANIKEKATESYAKWLEEKENERKKQMKSRRLSEKTKKENELERKQKCEEAYKLWLQKAKLHQKSKNNHFGYLGGKVTGYYDWTTYPMPSYSNPKPWVSPKVKTRYQSKIKLQNPSPPLLFEERERNEKRKQNHQVKQSRISIC
ncbi:coiled-coil domain-containing protein 34-like [Dendronephthya gigantea]|uniref:coiled-coil domain-containing protein 34-like n=1 Tax=Dendronephthya gigantea TaxID=151771 RepID=UPI00106C5061|nr:coiled-coil domain-containing protein 34-like [Dendronephthya gigantea]